MDAYGPEVERQMTRLFNSLGEKDEKKDRRWIAEPVLGPATNLLWHPASRSSGDMRGLDGATRSEPSHYQWTLAIVRRPCPAALQCLPFAPSPHAADAG
jgi:hypothetical protein